MMPLLLAWLLGLVQCVHLVGIGVTLWFLTLPVNRVDRDAPLPAEPPRIVMLYPVLDELEQTMRTTLTSIARASYPAGLVRIIAIPNHDDFRTLYSLRRLQQEFAFLEILPVPPTTDSSWDVVWSAWAGNSKAYWWHRGARAGDRDLPPKKTRQLIWATYQTAAGNGEALLSYIDADSAVPVDFWRTAAIGMQTYDVIQNTNINGNLLSTFPASFFAMDHISWDSTLYRHMSANGRHPYWVLGKGLFFRYRDLIELGGFNPWTAIEDPEVGMRMWTNGRTLGIVESPLVEEVPATWRQGLTQRKRWVAGFFQSLSSPLKEMGMLPAARLRARLNFVPCLSLVINPVGHVVGISVLVTIAVSDSPVLPWPVVGLSLIAMLLTVGVVALRWYNAWRYSEEVIPAMRDRLRYVVRVNPLFLLLYWVWWVAPLVVGYRMWRTDGAMVWERTEKQDANHDLVREKSHTPIERSVR